MRSAKTMHRASQRSQGGYTLVELMITVVIVAIGLALAVPAYENTTQRRQTTAQAEELASWLEFARSEAVKSNQQVSVQLRYSTANSWCVGANEGTGGCDCNESNTSSANYCSLNGVAHLMDEAGFEKASMTAYSNDTTFVFDPIRGIKNTGDLADHAYTLTSDNDNWRLQVNVGPTGKVRVCNPTSTKKVPGFDLCTQVSVPPIVVVTDPTPGVGPVLPPIVITGGEDDGIDKEIPPGK